MVVKAINIQKTKQSMQLSDAQIFEISLYGKSFHKNSSANTTD